ncbi:hypothetical protein OG702_33425 [Streptomyces sp. NBC_01198]|nr:hypothetical protein OG702_33425 [Streptomyces sp. NBC_01198]
MKRSAVAPAGRSPASLDCCHSVAAGSRRRRWTAKITGRMPIHSTCQLVCGTTQAYVLAAGTPPSG